MAGLRAVPDAVLTRHRYSVEWTSNVNSKEEEKEEEEEDEDDESII